MKRLFSTVAGLVLVVGSLGLVGVASASTTTTTATMTVTPNTGLTANQKVVITGTGFTTKNALVAVECVGTATTAAGCDLSALTSINVNADGTISATDFYVQTGSIGNGTCGTSASDTHCAIAIGTLAGTLVADAPITFATSTAVAAPSVTVTPSTGLTTGQSVTVTGSGFTPGDSLYVLECLATATGSTGCDVASEKSVTANSDGTLPSTAFTVATGTFGTGTCGTSATDLSGCVISVANATGGDVGVATITFAATTTPAGPAVVVSPSTNLKNGQTVTVTGSGFTPGDSLYVLECLATATGASGCNVATAKSITANSDGTLPSTPFTVVAGKIGLSACGTTSANAGGCIITVATITGTDTGAAPIHFYKNKKKNVPRRLFVRPSVNLRNGQVVTIFGRGFTPRDHVYIVECLVGAAGPGKCDLGSLKAVTIRPNGVLPSTKYRVVAGKIGSGFCGTTRANLHGCMISVANVHKGDEPSEEVEFSFGWR